MNKVIIDMASRNREFQEKQRTKLEQLKQINAPADLIEYQEMIAKMTLAEFKSYCKQCQEEDNKAKVEYAKNNPVQKSVVDEIYSRESELEYNYFTYSSNARFLMALNPLMFIGEEDFHNDLYDAFINHARELYLIRYQSQHVEQ